jgi:hypothetical protein
MTVGRKIKSAQKNICCRRADSLTTAYHQHPIDVPPRLFAPLMRPGDWKGVRSFQPARTKKAHAGSPYQGIVRVRFPLVIATSGCQHQPRIVLQYATPLLDNLINSIA